MKSRTTETLQKPRFVARHQYPQPEAGDLVADSTSASPVDNSSSAGVCPATWSFPLNRSTLRFE